MTLQKRLKYKAHLTALALMTLSVFMTALLVTNGPAYAQDSFEPQGILPAQEYSAYEMEGGYDYNSETHPPLRLTPDRSEILDVGENISRIIVGNQAHINVLLDTSKRAVVIPRAPGATFFVILGPDGKVLMQRHAIVANPKEKYIRIRQSCRSENCREMRMFYCPGMCHEIAIQGGGGGGTSGNVISSDNGPPSGDSDDGDNDDDDDDVPPPL